MPATDGSKTHGGIMSARTHSRPLAATTRGVDIRLPWWALALPTLAFVALLALMLNPTDAQAATGDPLIAHFLERARELLTS
jgi:anti-sigma-K factor RskA